ncbi:hypothetical protein YB2330_003352 [Saitoella coloradoensis]
MTSPRSSSSSSSGDSFVLDELDPTSARHAPAAGEAEPKMEEMDIEDEEEGLMGARDTLRKRTNFRRWLFGGVGIVSLLWLSLLAYYVLRKHPALPVPHLSLSGTGKPHITRETLDTGAFWPRTHTVSWLPSSNATHGTFLTRTNGELRVEDTTGSSSTLLKESDIKDPSTGNQLRLSKYWFSRDARYILLATDVHRNFRHSFWAKYWVYDTESHTTSAIAGARTLNWAGWSGNGSALAWVENGDLWVRSSMTEKEWRVTKDGGPNVFNGVPDWVYEEEVFQTNSVTWFSPTNAHVAYLRTNESQTPTYEIPYYIPENSRDDIRAYPENLAVKYPKPGFPNPVTEMYFYTIPPETTDDNPDANIGTPFTIPIEGDFSPGERIITELAWVGQDTALMHITNRDSSVLKTVILDITARTGYVVRTTDITAEDGGWFEVTRETRWVPKDVTNGRPEDGYIDIVIKDGNNHLAYYTPVTSSEPAAYLTSGNWEVDGGVKGLDLQRGLVYFVSTEKSSIERHVYSVELDGTGMKPITNTTEEAFYEVDFAPGAEWYTLSYTGPDVPWQKVLSTVDESYSHDLETNERVKTAVDVYDLPTFHYCQIKVDGYTLNAVEIRPPGFDDSGVTKYPVLFHPYGGPISQSVKKTFNYDWHSVLASDPDRAYITVIVDGRGTGFMGRKNRVGIRGQLGALEAKDQIEAGKQWAEKKYVDETKMAIWGWSFGAFLTLKVLEQGSGVFQYGMAVAPVTDWRYYDSVYTERYMGTVTDNLDGYRQSAIHDINNLASADRFLVMHGSGDDNVHFQNTLSLLDKLDLAGVTNYDMHVFPDSDHSIYFHNANPAVYRKLTEWLTEAFGKKKGNSWSKGLWENDD